MNDLNSMFNWVNNKPNHIYLDTASTCLKPKLVLDGYREAIEDYGIAVGRSSGELSYTVHNKIEAVSNRIKTMYNCDGVFYCGSATDGCNRIAALIEANLGLGVTVGLAIDNHHAALLPFYKFTNRVSIGLDDTKSLDWSQVPQGLDVLVITAMSNVLGNSLDYVKLREYRRANPQTIIVCDATQLLSCKHLDINSNGLDWVVCSAHKMYGPDGLGIVMYSDRMKSWKPAYLGGGIVVNVNCDDATYLTDGEQYTAGSVNLEGIVAMSYVLDWLEETVYNSPALNWSKLYDLDMIQVISTRNNKICTFIIKQGNALDWATYLAMHSIIVRIGSMCAMPLLSYLGVDECIRVSTGVYNTQGDIDRLVDVIIGNY
jgi:selenocysteine lyase/cysteine desulfurase